MMKGMHPSYTAKDTAEIFAQERAAAGSDAPVAIGNVRDAVVQFTPVKEFTTFLAEWTILDGAFVIHFFPPRERYVSNGRGGMQVHGEFLVKWQRAFPTVLDRVAQDHFKATAPRLQAMYTAEMFSWYFKAAGFADRIDPAGYLKLFFEKLDAGLDAISFLA